jgi:hypothetical protein
VGFCQDINELAAIEFLAINSTHPLADLASKHTLTVTNPATNKDIPVILADTDIEFLFEDNVLLINPTKNKVHRRYLESIGRTSVLSESHKVNFNSNTLGSINAKRVVKVCAIECISSDFEDCIKIMTHSRKTV